MNTKKKKKNPDRQTPNTTTQCRSPKHQTNHPKKNHLQISTAQRRSPKHHTDHRSTKKKPLAEIHSPMPIIHADPNPRNLWQTHSPSPISTLHLNIDLCAKPQTPISTPPQWSGVLVAMELWVWREGVSEDWKERESKNERRIKRETQ